MTISWLLIFLGGLLGSGHCVGMCGGFVLTLGMIGSPRPLANLRRQTLYGLGRVFTYASAGAIAGYSGWRLEESLGSAIPMQAILCVVAGLMLLVQGSISAGLLPLSPPRWLGNSCLGPSLLGGLLRETRARSAFLGGVINGLLPCGLVYAYLALAASAGGPGFGMGIMAVFGLGTMPLMVLTGCSGSVLSVASRRRALQIAAACVVLTGVLTIARGIVFLGVTNVADPPCPLCP